AEAQGEGQGDDTDRQAGHEVAAPGARQAPVVGLARQGHGRQVAGGQAPARAGCERSGPAHWTTFLTSVVLDGPLMHPRCRRVTALLARPLEVHDEFCGARRLPGTPRSSTGLSAKADGWERRSVS